jgi:anti-sigma regulatory factor (Ser/Thr protein kinase)
VLALDPATVRQARAFVQAHCDGAGIDADTSATAVLLTSETVTNAFIHGRSEARLAVTVTPNTVLVEVGDDNSRRPRRAEQDADALDGRGLAILDMLAARWGVRDTPDGKTVWFEVHAS